MAQLAEGTAISPIRKRVFQRMLIEEEFSADSVHRDDYVQSKGYPGALVSAYVITGYVTELMMRCFGDDWLATGSFKLKFIGTGLQQGDEVDICGTVRTATILEDGREQLDLDIWIDKLDGGARNVIGEASCIRMPAGSEPSCSR